MDNFDTFVNCNRQQLPQIEVAHSMDFQNTTMKATSSPLKDLFLSLMVQIYLTLVMEFHVLNPTLLNVK